MKGAKWDRIVGMCWGTSEHILNIPKHHHGGCLLLTSQPELFQKFGCGNETGRFNDHVTKGDEIKMKKKNKRETFESQSSSTSTDDDVGWLETTNSQRGPWNWLASSMRFCYLYQFNCLGHEEKNDIKRAWMSRPELVLAGRHDRSQTRTCRSRRRFFVIRKKTRV